MGFMTGRPVRWALAALLVAAAAAAGIAANVVLLGFGWQAAADPVGHFRPQLSLASTTYETRAPAAGTTAHSAKKHHRRVETAATQGTTAQKTTAQETTAQETTAQETTSLGSSGSGWTTEPEHEPGDNADD
jgi:hypothetical protein